MIDSKVKRVMLSAIVASLTLCSISPTAVSAAGASKKKPTTTPLTVVSLGKKKGTSPAFFVAANKKGTFYKIDAAKGSKLKVGDKIQATLKLGTKGSVKATNIKSVGTTKKTKLSGRVSYYNATTGRLVITSTNYSITFKPKSVGTQAHSAATGFQLNKEVTFPSFTLLTSIKAGDPFPVPKKSIVTGTYDPQAGDAPAFYSTINGTVYYDENGDIALCLDEPTDSSASTRRVDTPSIDPSDDSGDDPSHDPTLDDPNLDDPNLDDPAGAPPDTFDCKDPVTIALPDDGSLDELYFAADREIANTKIICSALDYDDDGNIICAATGFESGTGEVGGDPNWYDDDDSGDDGSGDSGDGSPEDVPNPFDPLEDF